MPRRLRFAGGGYVYDVLNRTVGRARILPRRATTRRSRKCPSRGRLACACACWTKGPCPCPEIGGVTSSCRDGGGVGDAAAIGGAGDAICRGVVARAHGEETGPAVHGRSAWSPANGSHVRGMTLRLPTRFPWELNSYSSTGPPPTTFVRNARLSSSIFASRCFAL